MNPIPILTENNLPSSISTFFRDKNVNELELELIRAKAELYKKNFYAFIKEFWEVVVVEKPIWNWHIEAIADELQKVAIDISLRRKKKHDVIINVPPGSSKSTICSVLYPVWCWVVDPSITLITASHDQGLANRFTNKSRELIVSDKFKKFFPHIQLSVSQNNKEDYENKNGGYRIATSSKASPTGRHALLLITDDIQNPATANSEVERNNVNSWITESLGTRKANKEVSVTIYVSQRLHEQDVTGMLLEREKNYLHICLPAEEGDNINPKGLKANYKEGLLDPVRLNHSIILEELENLGSKNFQTQMNQKPQSEESAIIKEKWMQIVPMVEYQKLITDNVPVIEFFADTAYTENTKNDPSALLACTKIGEILYILSISVVRFEFPQLISHLQSWTDSNGYTSRSRIHVEPKGSGQSIVQMLKMQSYLNIIEGISPKAGKIERLNSIAPIVEAGKVCLVQGTWNTKFISEVTANSPKHDDIRDVFVMAVETLMAKKKSSGRYCISAASY